MKLEEIEQYQFALDLLKENERHTLPYLTWVSDLPFYANHQVFSPKYFTSTQMFNANFPFKGNERFLEIGCGVGVTGILAAKRFQNTVVATDINQEAVKLTIKNAELNQVSHHIDVRHGSVYQPIAEYERFDTIYWNIPFLYSDESNLERLDPLQQAISDPGYNNIQRFISQASTYLAPKGRILFTFSSNGDWERMKKIVDTYAFKMRLHFQQKHPVYKEIEYQMYQLDLG